MHGGVYFRNFTVLSMRKGNYAFLLLAVALALKRADRFADLSKSDLRSNDKTITELGYRKIQ